MELFSSLLKKTGVVLLALMIFACEFGKKEKEATPQETTDMNVYEESIPSNVSKIFAGEINSLNDEANKGRSVTGKITLTILSDQNTEHSGQCFRT